MDRLSAFIVRRLRQMSRRAVRRRAARNGLLTCDVVIIGGHAVSRYAPTFDLGHLAGNADRDMPWIRRAFASFLITPPKDKSGDLDPMAPPLVLPPHLRRQQPSSDLQACELAAYAMRTICDAGEKLGVKHIVTALLLAGAIRDSGAALRDIADLLSQTGPVICIEVPAEGFERALMRLIEDTGLVPFGPYVGMAADFTFVGELWDWGEREAQRIFLYVLIEDDARLHRPTMRKQLTLALALGSPVLAVTEAGKPMPDPIDLTADLHLYGGGISTVIVADLLEAVYGANACAHAVAVSRIDAKMLTLDDLAIAVRPGRPITTSIMALEQLAARKRRERDEEDDGEGRAEEKRERKLITQSPTGKPRNAADRHDSADGSDGSTSSSGSRRRKKDKSTGSEIIQPVSVLEPQPTETKAGDTKPVLVETLSGYGAAVDWALGLKADVADYLTGDLAWSAMSTKLLLSGPPGTGKTTFARALCNSLQMPLVVTSVSTWLQVGYLGDVLERMTETFAEARAQAPCILFIDEIDGIGSRVSATRPYADYWNACVNKLLELLDGATRSEGVIVVGATNRPDEIDEAIRRSGRLETHIQIPRPDIDALTSILAHHLGADIEAVSAERPDSMSEGASS
ncbi:AAA family ATPase [Rhizobium ruizarguesonis]